MGVLHGKLDIGGLTVFKVYNSTKREFFKPIYRAHMGEVDEFFLTPSGKLVRRIVKNGSETLYHESVFLSEFGEEFTVVFD